MSMAGSSVTLRIRRMNITDLESVLEIDARSFPTPWPRQAYRYELEKNPASHLWVAAMQNREGVPALAGFIVVWLILDEVHIGTLAVHPQYRRRGIARALITRALSTTVKLGAKIATLEVRASNTAAQTLYRKFNFQEVGRRIAYYRDNQEDAVLMTLYDLDKKLGVTRDRNDLQGYPFQKQGQPNISS